MAVCKPSSGSSTHALDEVAPPGFTGQAMMDLAVKSHAATLEWAKGGSTGLTIVVSNTATEVSFLDCCGAP